MTGSSISSLVIGHRNSSGTSEPLSLALRASILLRRRPRRPNDSEEQHIARSGFASKLKFVSHLFKSLLKYKRQFSKTKIIQVVYWIILGNDWMTSPVY